MTPRPGERLWGMFERHLPELPGGFSTGSVHPCLLLAMRCDHMEDECQPGVRLGHTDTAGRRSGGGAGSTGPRPPP